MKKSHNTYMKMKIIYKYIIFIIQDISIIPRATNVVGRADQINSKLGQKCSSQRRCLAD